MVHRVCLAPMMGWTDRHLRYLVRQLSRRVLLYSEMVAAEALVFGNAARFLAYHPDEHPLAFQLGGHHPEHLAAAARAVEQAGIDEVNFNLGCPSPKGRKRRFGAHLMLEPEVAVECVQAMVEAVRIPVTVKTRIGADDFDSYDWLCGFVGQLRSAGCTTFIVHARKAWLKGLSPKENREVPPLDHSRVYRLKRDFPDLHIVLNGGIHQWSEVRRHLQYVDGVMIGRHGYQEPQWWATLDQDFFGCSLPPLTGVDLLVRCRPYVQAHLESGRRLYDIVRHLVGLYRRLPSASAFRRFIACNCSERRADLKTYDTLIEIAHHLEGGNSPWKVA